MYLSRFVTPALFVLLNIQSQTVSRIGGAPKKKNADVVRNLKDKDNNKIADANRKNATANGKNAEEGRAIFNESQFKMQFGIEDSDISQNLSKEEIDKLLDSYGPNLNPKQQYIVFHHYNKYLNKIYNEKVDKMWDLSEKLALKYQVPHEAKVKYWYQCESRLKHDLKSMNNYSYKNFYLYIQEQEKPIQPAIKFKLFLSLHFFTWNKEMNENEQKRVEILTQKMQNYNKNKDKHHMK
ncbi:RAD protein [Plasmodium cynomolgi strain B]|uniref:RAD protein n=1 Tax=Plasmodium cynomolgi (strain B) TaxID=1120755 RepID=K6VA50_PLACD|nr:RAD protein [Plasmodium cynomolgi strain B]GAB66022.1 RAD protein [Plasmodium cynomolgi strain B]